jgi:single-strand DNA-binding protein
MSYNRVIILGRLGKDPEVRYTQGGLTVANLRLATNERRPDGNGGWKEETEWHSVVLFGKQADTAKQYLTKGREVLIEGFASHAPEWQDKDGQKRYSTEIVRAEHALRRRGGGRGGAGGGAPGGQGFERGADDQGAPVGADDFSEFGGGGGGDDSDIPF